MFHELHAGTVQHIREACVLLLMPRQYKHICLLITICKMYPQLLHELMLGMEMSTSVYDCVPNNTLCACAADRI